MPDLGRFLQAQEPVWPDVLAELGAGRKVTHWMWFVFPRLRGLGQSERSLFYGLDGLAEARAYCAHSALGPRLVQCADLLLRHSDRSAAAILGTVDAVKLQSCATLFSWASAAEQFPALLSTFFAAPCARTEAALR